MRSSTLRTIIAGCGLLLLLAGGLFPWRALPPPLTDTQQVQANLLGLAQAIEEMQPRNVVAYLAPEFAWRGLTRENISQNMGGFSLQWRDVDLNLAGVQVQLAGERATSSGTFTLRYRRRGAYEIQTRVGRFKVFWEKRDGQWLAVAAEGGESIEP